MTQGHLDVARSYVVATAGHVDHGKSALVAALTGMDPDRWHEEKARGLTIDLGFAWTTLSTGEHVTFVDVPGHEKFIGNTLAGLGAAPVVAFVVSADEGWSAQSSEHRDAIAALCISDGVLVITKTDRAPEQVRAVAERLREEFAHTGLRDAPIVAVSALGKVGLNNFRSVLSAVLQAVSDHRASPDEDAACNDRVRLWIDRSFTINGAGAVVTGTLTAGTMATGDTFELVAPGRSPRVVAIRGLQSRGERAASLTAVDRVAANLRGVNSTEVSRGDVLLTPASWHLSLTADVRRTTGTPFTAAPRRIQVHVGTASQEAQIRAFDADHARLTFRNPIPLRVSDPLLLRDPGSRRIFGGAAVLDPDPPMLTRRGDGQRRGERLTGMRQTGDVVDAVNRCGALTQAVLDMRGYLASEADASIASGDLMRVGEWLVSTAAYAEWTTRLEALVMRANERDPLAGGLQVGSATRELGDPAARFLGRLIRDAGMESVDGRVRPIGGADDLGDREDSIRELETRLQREPFSAPQAETLALLGLELRHIAAAERLGRLLRLPGGVIVLPSAPDSAMTILAGLAQPFTTSAARQALGTSRRVVIPLLEYLDSRGRTRRVNELAREVVG